VAVPDTAARAGARATDALPWTGDASLHRTRDRSLAILVAIFAAILVAVVVFGYLTAASASYQGCVTAASLDRNADPEQDCNEWIPWPQRGFAAKANQTSK
jgi:hypothetical protein